MPDPVTLVFFAAASVALLAIPGPAVLFIVARSMQQGRSAGLISVVGVHAGSMVHVMAAALGLSALLASSAVAFTTVRYLGAGYLIYLGIRQLWRRPSHDPREPLPQRRWRLLRQGFVVNLLNPKTAVFFLAFLPQFVDPARGAAWLQVVVLGVLFIALGILSDGAYAVAAGTVGDRLRRSLRMRQWLGRLSGGVYLGLGILTALSRNSASRA